MILIIGCSCWHILVERQKGICWCPWGGHCHLGLVRIAWVSPSFSCMPCIDSVPCNLVPVVQCYNIHQQVSLLAFSLLALCSTYCYDELQSKSLIDRSPPHIPDVHLPEEPFLQVATALRIEINGTLALLRDIASGRDVKKFLGVRFFAMCFFLKIIICYFLGQNI